MTNLQKAFLSMVRNCGIKEGDTVQIVCAVPSEHLGWSAVWTQEMDKTVNAVGKVTKVYDGGFVLAGFRVETCLGSWSYPPFCLKNIPPKKVPTMVGKTVEVKIDGKTYTAEIVSEK